MKRRDFLKQSALAALVNPVFAKILKAAIPSAGMRMNGRVARRVGTSPDRCDSYGNIFRAPKVASILRAIIHLRGLDGCREPYTPATA